ncbi:MAG: hypothetical protein K6C12_11825 [Oscillospiraceae bacterium]|nr:hypothetical protein [Oscillospiraceae bacterium]
MQENVELVQNGFRILLRTMSGYIGQKFSAAYHKRWWDEVLSALNDQYDLPYDGSYEELTDSLDIANCIRLIDRKWNEIFRNCLKPSCRAWARELMGVRNIVAHNGQKDLDQPMAERALDTMALLCAEMDRESAEEIRVLYREARSRADDESRTAAEKIQYAGLAQPESESRRGALTEGSLLKLDGTEVVQKTTLTRKVTYGGKTVVYPVFRVRLDALFYNDQNDRIATWISRYESENGQDSLQGLNREIYNQIIENFVVDSNPESIQKTQKNISLVGQREPGVTLADGRIVDGNRRFTCLRRIQREVSEPIYFETVIMDMDIQEDRRQIKLLELAIQHGEEKKVEYDLVDYAIGTYRDIVQTKLLTVEEYAATANESAAEVRRRLELAGLIDEFLNYVRMPGQFYIAREYQITDLFQEMMAPLHQLKEQERNELKQIVFTNTMMKAIPDQRKYIRDLRNLIRTGTYEEYFEDQKKLCGAVNNQFGEAEIHSRADADRFADRHSEQAEELQLSLQRALLRSRSQQMKAKPSENVSKCINLMMEVDSRMFGRLGEEERGVLKAELDRLGSIVSGFREML